MRRCVDAVQLGCQVVDTSSRGREVEMGKLCIAGVLVLTNARLDDDDGEDDDLTMTMAVRTIRTHEEEGLCT